MQSGWKVFSSDFETFDNGNTGALGPKLYKARIIGYDLDCGKTENTPESYKLNCNKTNGESYYKLICEK